MHPLYHFQGNWQFFSASYPQLVPPVSVFTWNVKDTWASVHYSGEHNAAVAEKLRGIFHIFGHCVKSNIWIFLRNAPTFLLIFCAFFGYSYGFIKPFRFFINSIFLFFVKIYKYYEKNRINFGKVTS